MDVNFDIIRYMYDVNYRDGAMISKVGGELDFEKIFLTKTMAKISKLRNVWSHFALKSNQNDISL